MSVEKVMRAGNRVLFVEERTYIEDKVTGEKRSGHRRWRDVRGEDVGQHEGGFVKTAGERAGESTGSIKADGRTRKQHP